MSKIWDISCILQCPTQDCSEALIVNNYIKAFHSSRCDVGVLIVKHVHREKSKCQYPTLINFLVAARLDKNPKAMSIYHMSNTTVTERHDPSLLALRNMFIYPLSICQVNIQLFCIKSSLQWSDRKTSCKKLRCPWVRKVIWESQSEIDSSMGINRNHVP